MTTALVVLLCVHTLGTLVSRWLRPGATPLRLVVRLEAIAGTPLSRARAPASDVRRHLPQHRQPGGETELMSLTLQSLILAMRLSHLSRRARARAGHRGQWRHLGTRRRGSWPSASGVVLPPQRAVGDYGRSRCAYQPRARRPGAHRRRRMHADRAAPRLCVRCALPRAAPRRVRRSPAGPRSRAHHQRQRQADGGCSPCSG